MASGKTVAALLTDQELYASEAIEARLGDLTERYLAGCPLAYLLGQWDFRGLTLTVTPDVLIPRDDTLAVTELAIERLQGREGPLRAGRRARSREAVGAIRPGPELRVAYAAARCPRARPERARGGAAMRGRCACGRGDPPLPVRRRHVHRRTGGMRGHRWLWRRCSERWRSSRARTRYPVRAACRERQRMLLPRPHRTWVPTGHRMDWFGAYRPCGPLSNDEASC